MTAAIEFGMPDHRECAGHKQSAQIAITLFADAAEPLTPAARMLLGHQSNPSREMASRSEAFRIADARDQCGSKQRTYTRNTVQALAHLIGAVPGQDHPVKLQDLLLEPEQLVSESRKAPAHKLGHPIVVRIDNDAQQFLD